MKKARLILDVLMALALPCLMAYDLIGQETHEIIGLCAAGLFILHHVFNRRWHGRLFRGKYTAYRTALTTLDVLMTVIFISQAVCGILMAKHVLPFLPHVGRRSIARVFHLLGAYWGFALTCIHGGMHLTGILRMWKRWRTPAKAISAVLVCGAATYGVIALVRRGWLRYMTLREQFVFFDFDEPIILFFKDVLAILILFVLLGCLTGTVLKKARRKTT